MKKELPACPVETTLMLISDRWKVLIIRDLLGGTKRFGELKKSIGTVSGISKGTDFQSAFHGRKRTAHPQSLCRSASPGGIYAD